MSEDQKDAVADLLYARGYTPKEVEEILDCVDVILKGQP